MDFGRISRLTGEIGLEEWNLVIESSDFLLPIPDREGTNPFTQEKMVISGAGKAYYLENGERTGNIALEDGELLTTGVPESACQEIAKELGAQVLEDDRS